LTSLLPSLLASLPPASLLLASLLVPASLLLPSLSPSSLLLSSLLAPTSLLSLTSAVLSLLAQQFLEASKEFLFTCTSITILINSSECFLGLLKIEASGIAHRGEDIVEEGD
jgi:hypothetical protein